jgi:hypothetical protein
MAPTRGSTSSNPKYVQIRHVLHITLVHARGSTTGRAGWPTPSCARWNLAISPQCGFASTSAGNVLTVDEERRKLELVVDTAQKIWG